MRPNRWIPTIVAFASLLAAAPLAAQTAEDPAATPPPPAEATSAAVPFSTDAGTEAPAPAVTELPAPTDPDEAPPPATPAPEPEPPPTAEESIDREQVERAVIEYDTPWNAGYGLLVQDDTTVVIPAPGSDTGRGITVRAVRGGAEAEAALVEVAVPRSADQRFWIMTLAGSVGGAALEPSAEGPALGERVFTLDMFSGDDGEPQFELVETTVTSVSETRFTLGTGAGQGYDGAPVLDASGRVLGLLDGSSDAVRIERILSREERLPRPMAVLPQFGFLGFYEWGGLSDGSGGVRVRFGVALWDQLGILLNLGVNAGSDQRIARLDPVDGSGAGMVGVTDLGFDAGLDLEYRLLLARTTMPLYAKLVVGFRYSFMGSDPVGLPVYSSSPTCDPFADACRLTSGPMPDSLGTHAVGLSVGADLAWGGVTLGYRFVPGDAAYQLPNTHTLLFGVSVF